MHQIVNTQAPGMELFWVGWSLETGSGGEAAALHLAFRGADVTVAQDAAVWHLWRALRCVTGRGGLGWEIEAQNLAAALLFSLLRVGAGPHAPAALFERATSGHDRRALARAAVRYVEDNLNRRLPLAEIANHLHVSPRQLTRLFVEVTGVPPAAYIERARLDRAARLLLQSPAQLKAVAREVGFADTAHFSRVFSRCYGAPPGEFRKRGAVGRDSGPKIQENGAYV